MDAMTIIVVGLIALIAVTGAVSVVKPEQKNPLSARKFPFAIE